MTRTACLINLFVSCTAHRQSRQRSVLAGPVCGDSLQYHIHSFTMSKRCFTTLKKWLSESYPSPLPDGNFKLTSITKLQKNCDIHVVFCIDTFHYMFKAEFVALLSSKVPSGGSETNGVYCRYYVGSIFFRVGKRGGQHATGKFLPSSSFSKKESQSKGGREEEKKLFSLSFLLPLIFSLSALFVLRGGGKNKKNHSLCLQ